MDKDALSMVLLKNKKNSYIIYVIQLSVVLECMTIF